MKNKFEVEIRERNGRRCTSPSAPIVRRGCQVTYLPIQIQSLAWHNAKPVLRSQEVESLPRTPVSLSLPSTRATNLKGNFAELKISLISSGALTINGLT